MTHITLEMRAREHPFWFPIENQPQKANRQQDKRPCNNGFWYRASIPEYFLFKEITFCKSSQIQAVTLMASPFVRRSQNSPIFYFLFYQTRYFEKLMAFSLCRSNFFYRFETKNLERDTFDLIQRHI